MIVSASRRTDIPAFFSDWLLLRLREGRALVPQPRRPDRLTRVDLRPAAVDCLVFWTKNPAPMLEKLRILDGMGHRYYFSFTVTPYGPDLEPHLPPKAEVADTFRRLADRLGPRRVDWRYDPIVFDARHTVQWHLDQFGRLCRRLEGATERCLVNVVKTYRHLKGRVPEAEAAAVRELAGGLAAIAAEVRLPLFTCTGQWDLTAEGFGQAACIDRAKIEALLGRPVPGRKDPGQPRLCRCLESVDLGMYDTCAHGCLYCYATSGGKAVRRRLEAHDAASPLLSGRPTGMESVTDRPRRPVPDEPTKLF